MKPETKAKYPSNWREISRATIKARGGKCEECNREAGDPYPILTVHHIDYNPANNKPSNLAVLCQGCHLRRQWRELRHAIRYEAMQYLVDNGQLPFPGLTGYMAKRRLPARIKRILEIWEIGGHRARPGNGRSGVRAGQIGIDWIFEHEDV